MYAIELPFVRKVAEGAEGEPPAVAVKVSAAAFERVRGVLELGGFAYSVVCAKGVTTLVTLKTARRAEREGVEWIVA